MLRERGLDGAMDGMPWQSAMIYARARLWLAEGDYERALAEATASGAQREEQRAPEPHVDAVAVDRGAGARAPRAPRGGGRDGRRRARRWPSASARRCRSSPRCTRARSPSPTTPRAWRCASARWRSRRERPALLESVRARLELGSTLAHMGRRIEARDALRPALADADAVGAVLLAQRARRELVATGLRPRQAATRGRRRADPAPAPDMRARRRRQGQPPDRPGALPEHQDRRDAPRRGLSQARRGHPRRPRRPARAVDQTDEGPRATAPSTHSCIDPSNGQSPLVYRAAIVEMPDQAPRTTSSG